MLEPPQLALQFDVINIALILKIVMLVAIFLYALVSFFIYNKILSLNRIVFFPPRTAANQLGTVALIYFIGIIALFFIALVLPA